MIWYKYWTAGNGGMRSDLGYCQLPEILTDDDDIASCLWDKVGGAGNQPSGCRGIYWEKIAIEDIPIDYLQKLSYDIETDYKRAVVRRRTLGPQVKAAIAHRRKLIASRRKTMRVKELPKDSYDFRDIMNEFGLKANAYIDNSQLVIWVGRGCLTFDPDTLVSKAVRRAKDSQRKSSEQFNKLKESATNQ